MRLLISACLPGCPCRYDGGSNLQPRVAALRQNGIAIYGESEISRLLEDFSANT